VLSFSLYLGMDLLARAIGLLQKTEAELRKIVSEAASAGDYGSVVQIAALARSMSEILDPASSKASKPVRRQLNPSSARDDGPGSRMTRTRSARSNGDYPRFARHGDQLVRIAWSKRDKREYEHKAPFAVLRALTAGMAEKGSDGRVFSTDQLLPIRDEDGSEVPTYQVYAGIALLKQVGLIDQHGRQGYSIPRLSEFKRAVEAVWKNLPEK
jgi:hypothetical protein